MSTGVWLVGYGCGVPHLVETGAAATMQLYGVSLIAARAHAVSAQLMPGRMQCPWTEVQLMSRHEQCKQYCSPETESVDGAMTWCLQRSICMMENFQRLVT